MKRVAVLLAGLAAAAAVAQTPAPTARTALGAGYLAPVALPDSRVLVPPAPVQGSMTQRRDAASQKAALKLRGGPRWSLATADAELFAPGATGAFSCAAGLAIGPATNPATDRLLRKTLPDLGLASRAAKQAYSRARPFMINQAPTCTPQAEAALRQDGSYPSGHSAIGYGWGLILAELVPARGAQLVARGRAFGDSRRVCNVHWLSDVEEGRTVGAAVVAALHADPAFQRDLAAARAELAALAAGAPAQNCTAETVALSVGD